MGGTASPSLSQAITIRRAISFPVRRTAMTEMAARDDGRALPDWVWGAGVMVAMILLSRISDVASLAGLPIKPWKPGGCLALGMMMVRGMHLLPWVLLGQAGAVVAASLASGAAIAWGAPVGAAFAVSVGFWLAADHLRRRARIDMALSSSGDVLRFFGVVAVVVPVVSSLELAAFAMHGPVTRAELPAAFLRLCVGHLIGIAVLTPIVLRLHVPGSLRWSGAGRAAIVEVAGFCVALVIVTWFIFGLQSTDEFKLFDLLFLPIVAFAVRHGLDGALAGLAVTQVTMIGWLAWHDFPAPAVVELQTLLLILAATCIFVGVVVDERERAGAALRANERRLRDQDAQLARITRLNAIGEMASTLAHELNQPLTAVRAHLRAAQRRLEADPPTLDAARTDLRDGVVQIDHAAGIIRRLREFLRRGDPRRAAVDAAALAREVLALAEREVRLVLHIPAPPPPVLADRVEIQQVLLNLVRNAAEASRAAPRDRRVELALTVAAEGRAVEFAVRDDGSGIAPEIRARLFAAFATTKPHGLGLGLAISRTIVEAHGGRIWLESSDESGTEFRFTLPVAEERR
jgi:signal transduction histidine kinase